MKVYNLFLGILFVIALALSFNDANAGLSMMFLIGCWTQVPEYNRTDIPKMNKTVNNEVTRNLDFSWNDEKTRQPDLSFLRSQVPKEIKSDLALGGRLRSDTQDTLVQGALNDTAGSGVINSFSGRGAVAKDLGQMSEGLHQTRLARAQDYVKSEPLEFLGLKAGDIGSIFVDDKVRQFQNKKDQAQAQQADTATNIAIGLGVANMVASLI
jgi:hypothetical protein